MSTYFKLGSLIEGIVSTATADGTTTLTSSSKTVQVFTGTLSQTVVLPDATTMSNGRRFEINNRSTGIVTVQYNGGSSAATITADSQVVLRLTDKSTSAGVWDLATSSGGGGTSVTAQSKLDYMQGLAGINYNDGTTISKILKFTPEEIGGNFWTTKAPMNVARKWSDGFTVGGHGYAVGGDQSLTSSERYDDTNNYWLSRGTLLTGIDSHGGFDLSAIGYICGGLTGGAANSAQLQSYTPGTNAWATKTSFGTARYGVSAFSLNGYGFAAGGKDIGGSAFTTVEQYSSSTDAWYVRSPIGTARGCVTSFSSLNSFGYMAGGTNAAFTRIGTVEKFQDSSNTWYSLSALTGNSSFYAGSVQNGFLYVSGGEDLGGTATASVVEYNDFTNAWVAKSSLSSARTNSFGLSINGAGYACGGGGPVSTVAQYRNVSFLSLGSIKRSTKTPTAIYAAVSSNGITHQVPIQVRTNGDNWKIFEANKDSALKSSETLKSKFTESGLSYIAGGADSGTGLITVTEFYNPSVNTWTNKATPSGRASPFGFAIDGVGIYAGGFNPALTSLAVNTADKYNEVTDIYTAGLATMATAEGNGQSFALLGLGYAVGGAPNGGAVTGSALNQQYNNTANSWASKTVIPSQMVQGSGWKLLDRGYITSGFTDSSSGTHAIGYAYNPISDAWLSVASAPTADRQTSGFALNDFGYRVGSTGVGNDNRKYDPNLNTWSTVQSSTSNHADGTGWSSIGFGYVVGNSSATATSEQYNTASNTWFSTASLNTGTRRGAQNFTPGVYRNYEVRVGIPAFIAGLGAGVWTTKSAVPISGNNAGCGSGLSGFAYYCIGRNGSSDSVVTTKYAPASDTWTQSFNTTATHDNGCIGTMGGFMFVTKGYVHASPNGTTERLDENTGWTTRATATAVTGSTQGGCLNGLFYSAGADTTYFSPNTYTEVFNDTTNAWAAKALLNSGRYGATSFVLKGFLYLASGQSNQAAEQYNDAANAWTTKATCATNHGRGVGYMMNDYGYSVAGENGPTAVVERYSDTFNVWTSAPSIPVASAGNGSAVMNGSGYAFGFGNPYNQNYQFTPSNNKIVAGIALRIEE